MLLACNDRPLGIQTTVRRDLPEVPWGLMQPSERRILLHKRLDFLSFLDKARVLTCAALGADEARRPPSALELTPRVSAASHLTSVPYYSMNSLGGMPGWNLDRILGHRTLSVGGHARHCAPAS